MGAAPAIRPAYTSPLAYTYLRATLKHVVKVMDKQNITLSIRKDILQKVKILAVKRSTSVSALLTELLEEIVARDEGYQAARQEHTRLLKDGFDLGTYGSADWSRDDLHDR